MFQTNKLVSGTAVQNTKLIVHCLADASWSSCIFRFQLCRFMVLCQPLPSDTYSENQESWKAMAGRGRFSLVLFNPFHRVSQGSIGAASKPLEFQCRPPPWMQPGFRTWWRPKQLSSLLPLSDQIRPVHLPKTGGKFQSARGSNGRNLHPCSTAYITLLRFKLSYLLTSQFKQVCKSFALWDQHSQKVEDRENEPGNIAPP